MIVEIESIPNIHQQERRDAGAGIWGSEFGRLASRDWAASPRLSEVRGVGSSRSSSAAKQAMVRSKSGDSLKNYAVPNGPDPGRPDWHRMFAGESLREPVSSGSENEGDSSSEVRIFGSFLHTYFTCPMMAPAVESNASHVCVCSLCRHFRMSSLR
jgi:hypothetical protein